MNFYFFSWVNGGLFMKLLPIKCSYEGADYVDVLLLVTVIPIVITILWYFLYCGCYLVVVYWGHGKTASLCHSLKVQFFSIFLLFTYLVLPSISTITVGAINCRNVDPDGAVGSSLYYLRYSH